MTFGHPRFAFLAAVFITAVFVCTANAQNVQVNDKPLRDFGENVRSRIEQKQLDITKPFAVEMSAVITSDGKLDKNASKFTSQSGDAKMAEVAKQAIFAMGDSGYFGYLQQAGISQATLSVSQTEQTFTGSVRSSKGRFEAAIVTSGINLALKAGLSQDMQPNEKLILENTRASHNGGDIDITCTLPAADFQRMILGNTAAGSGPNQ
jgi:hypothetical protein